MKINIITAALPPKLNGIGDYTARFASAIAPLAEVTILTARQPPATALPEVTIKPVFDVAQLRSVSALFDVVRQDRPDWILLQFEQFFYGPKWGFNPYLPLVIRKIKRECPKVRFALMAHERFVSFATWQTTIMASWQRWQYASLVRSADVVFFSIEYWANMLRSHQPDKRVVHLPVGSNIPHMPISYETARKCLGVHSNICLIGLFGSPIADPSMMQMVRKAIRVVQATGQQVLLLYMGPRGAMVKEAMEGIPVIADGPLPAEEVSRRFAAMDVYLVPIEEGVTTRRGTLMAGLQHGIATLTTSSPLTDTILQRSDEKALLLSPVQHQEKFCDDLVHIAGDLDLRRRLRSGAQTLYEAEFAWPQIAARFLAALEAAS